MNLPWALINAGFAPSISTFETSAGDRRPVVILGVSLCIPPTPSSSESPTYIIPPQSMKKIKILQHKIKFVLMFTKND